MKVKNFGYLIIFVGIFSLGVILSDVIQQAISNNSLAYASNASVNNSQSISVNSKIAGGTGSNGENNKKNNNNNDKKEDRRDDRRDKKEDRREDRRDDKKPENKSGNKPERQVVVKLPEHKPYVVENNNNIENNSNDQQTVNVERGEEKIVYVTDAGTPVYQTQATTKTPDTGADMLPFLTLIPGSIAGLVLRKKALLG